MITNLKSSASSVELDDFNLLRARIEPEVARPAVIVITSSSVEDGDAVAAHGLASSLASIRYRTLLVDTTVANATLMKSSQCLTLEEIAQDLIIDPLAGTLNLLTLNDPMIQKTSSQGQIDSVLEILRSRFDYVVINAEFSGVASFATSLVSVADAVIVSVRKGRRETSDDYKLSIALKRTGKRFLGIVALDYKAIKHYAATYSLSESYRIRPAPLDNPNTPSSKFPSRRRDGVQLAE